MTPHIHPTLRLLARPSAPLAAVLLTASLCAPVQAQQLFAPTAMVGGYSQSFLSAQLAQWEFSIPAATNPLLDLTGAHSAQGDQGKYFFLSSAFTTDPVVRSVTVRTDQALVFSPITVVFWADAVFNTEAAMRADAVHALGNVSNLTVTVDGAPALLPGGITSLDPFLQAGPLFPLSLPPGGVIETLTGNPPGVFPAITLGYTFALEALTAGQHQLRFTATTAPSGPHAANPPFSYDITYNIAAVPEPGTEAMLCLGLAAVGALAVRNRRVDRNATA